MISSALDAVTANPALSSYLRPPAFLCGMVFGVSACPDIPMPETWMPWALGGDHPDKVSAKNVDQIANGLLAQLQWQLSKMKNEESLLPSECLWSDNAADREILETWLKGLLFAHGQLETVWKIAWDHANTKSIQINEGDVRLKRCLKCFSVLADSDFALAPLSGESHTLLESNLPVLHKQLGSLLSDYVSLANELATGLPGQFELYKHLSD